MDEECYVPQGPKMFLRLIPTVPNPEITPEQALDKAREGRLQSFTLSIINGGEWYERNRFGAIVYRTAPDAPAIEHLTQLFKNSELWGLSTELEQTRRELGHGVLLSGYEHAFLRALDNYLDFSLDHLQLRLPLRLVAGITGIEGFRMAAPPGMRFGGWERWGGRAVEPHVTFSVTVSDRKTPRIDMLMPFFEMVWEAFGLERPNTSG